MDNALRWTLRASVVYDLVAFVLLMAMPQWLFDLFAHPRPNDPFLFRLAGLPLLMAPPVYWLASVTLERALVRASVLMRVVGGAGIAAIVVWHAPAGAMAYWSFVVGDFVWAALIVAAQRRRPR